jgi:hypothetical protein
MEPNIVENSTDVPKCITEHGEIGPIRPDDISRLPSYVLDIFHELATTNSFCGVFIPPTEESRNKLQQFTTNQKVVVNNCGDIIHGETSAPLSHT